MVLDGSSPKELRLVPDVLETIVSFGIFYPNSGWSFFRLLLVLCSNSWRLLQGTEVTVLTLLQNGASTSWATGSKLLLQLTQTTGPGTKADPSLPSPCAGFLSTGTELILQPGNR